MVSDYDPTTWKINEQAASKLTARELEVAYYTAWGLTGDEVASRLFISIETVKTYKKQIKRKLRTRNFTHSVTTLLTGSDDE